MRRLSWWLLEDDSGAVSGVALYLIYRKFKTSFPGPLRRESGIVGEGAVRKCSRSRTLIPPGTVLRQTVRLTPSVRYEFRSRASISGG